MWIVLLALIFSNSAFAQSEWTHYTFEGGRNANALTTITEDNSENIWVGTLEKLHWYNGVEFQSVDEINGRVWDIAVSPNNDVWAITYGGISRFSNGQRTLFMEGGYSRLGFDSRGNLWTSNSGAGYLQKYDGETWTSYDNFSDITIQLVYVIETTESGDIWIGTNDGIYQTHVDSLDSWNIYTTEDGLPGNMIVDIDIGPDGIVWAFSYDDGISYLDQGVWIPITHEDEEVDPGGIDNLEVDNYGTPWCRHVTYNLCAYINGVWETNYYEPANFFNNTEAIFIDSQDRIWIGIDEGVYCHQLEPTVTGVLNAAPEAFTLSSPNPNPFNPTTTITYTLPESSPVTLAVYNISGQRIATLVDEQQSAGMHTVTFDGAGLASGLYFARMTAGGMVETEKMLLVK